MDKNHLVEYNNCNIEMLPNNAISAALLYLDPYKDYYYNRHLLIDRDFMAYDRYYPKKFVIIYISLSN